MNKRIISLLLTVAMFTALCMPAFADDSGEKDIYNAEFSEFLTHVNANTISFEDENFLEEAGGDMPNRAPGYKMSEEQYDRQQKQQAKLHNDEVIQRAKQYVRSLDLQSRGLGFIEDSCIEELESYEGMDGAKILSYTVYTPKSNSPSIDELKYFGTYQARKFYTYFPSSLEAKSNIKKDSKSILQKWASNLVGCILVFQTMEVNAAWTAFQIMMGAPRDYTVQRDAFTESYCNLNIRTRGIYTQYGNGDYDMVTSQQYAQTYPYMIFHPVDSPKYEEFYGKKFGFSGNVYSAKYKKSSNELCKEAWQVFNGSLVMDKFDKIEIRSFKTVWPKK